MSIETSVQEDLPVSGRYVKYQYLAVCIVNILTLCHGCTIGWLSPAIPILKSNETTLLSGPATVSEISWIGSYFSIGSLLGNLLFSVVLRYAGLRRTMYALVLPNVVFWLCVLFARYPIDLYVGRLMAGLTGGGIYLCVPVFVSDIADRRIRGALGSFLMMFLSFGILLSFVAGTYMNYTHVPYVFVSLPFVYVLGLLFMPDTCQQLLARDRLEEAEKSFIFYRLGNKVDTHQKFVAEELRDLQLYLKTRETNEANVKVWEAVCNARAIKGILTGLCLTAANIFSGTLAMLSYTSLVFRESGSTVDADVSAIIVGVVQVVSVYVSSHLVDRLGRKTLLIISCSGAAIATAGLGAFAYLHKHDVSLIAFEWVPLVLFSFYTVITCLGLLPLPFIILAEILPTEVRQTGSTICMISISVFAFVSMKTFPLITAAYGLYTMMWICTGVTVLGTLYAIFILRETKGKNLYAPSKEVEK